MRGQFSKVLWAWIAARGLCLWTTLLFLAGCATPPSFQERAAEIEKTFSHPESNLHRHTYVLQFDYNGKLMNFSTLLRAVHEINAARTNGTPFQRIAVVSYGWSYDVDTGESDYYNFLTNYDTYTIRTYKPLTNPVETAVICVAWPSGVSGVGKAVSDVIPGNALASYLAIPLEAVFPLSVWSKASLADRVGYGDLKNSLDYLYEHVIENAPPKDQPEIYLFGHSFGCRVLSASLRRNGPPAPLLSPSHIMTRTGRPSPGRGFRSHVNGAMFVEPALTEGNLPAAEDCATFPLLVIQSRHDHLNSLLYPLANLPLNTYIASEYENWLIQSRSPMAQFGVDFLHLPYVLAASAVSWPWSYVEGQGRELADPANWNWRTNLLTDSLKQLPVLDAALQEGLGNASYHKGAFNLGSLHESAARLVRETGRDVPIWLDQIVSTNGGESNLTLKLGINFVNAQEVVSRSLFSTGLDYNSKFADYTVGWLDPVGSHDDTRPHRLMPCVTNFSPQIYDLIYDFVNHRVQTH
jgi:hypothetical protein